MGGAGGGCLSRSGALHRVISLRDYFDDSISHFSYTPTPDDEKKARILLERVNALLGFLDFNRKLTSGHRTRAKTLLLKTQGYGAAIGGAHETSEGIDIEDEDGELDEAITDSLLERFSLYREDPATTRRWVHVQTRPPKSGKRTFLP